MWREWISKVQVAHEELHLVIIEDLSPTRDRDDPACELMVNRHHFSCDRQQIASADFADLAEAKDYCFKKYGIAPGDWTHEIAFSETFQFNYTVTNCGVPQPHPVAGPNARILFRCSLAGDEDGRKSQVLNICGTREGMRRLAAMLVLCADSDKYDPAFHIHLEDEEDVETDMEVTIRAPTYLDVLDRGEFSEFKGPTIIVPADEAGDSTAT
jgi:hypothetical protein